MRSVDEILDKIKEVRGLSADAELARIFKVKPSTLASWRARRTLPYEQIIAFCEHEGFDISYILLGKEEAQGVAEEQEPFNSDFLREVIIGVEEFLKEEGKDLEPKDKATLITTLFTEAQKMEAEGVDASSRAFRLSRLIARFVGSH